jgi:Ca2+-transporting ATPase
LFTCIQQFDAICFFNQIGKISAAIQSGFKRKVKTPIQRKLSKLGIYLVALAIFLCALVVAIGVIWKKDTRQMVNIGLR